jgi:NitT/TauT family transport system substrate-binding protein
MIMRRTAGLLLLTLLLATTAQAKTLRMGILPVLDTLPLQVAVHDGLFADEGLDVELVPFASALERDTAMQSGQLDGYFGDLLNTLLLIQGGVPMRIATVSYATTPGQPMFALATAPGKEAVEPDVPLTVGISKATIIEFLLDRMRMEIASVAALELDKTEIRKIPIRLQMLLSGQIDAALLPEPLASLARSRGAAWLATDESLGIPLTVVCLHERLRGEFDDFLDAYEEAVERINDRPGDYHALMVETCRIPESLAADFPVYRYPEPDLPTEDAIWRVQQWMLSRGMLNSMLDYGKLVP